MATEKRVIVVSDLHIGGAPTASSRHPFEDSRQIFHSASKLAAFLDGVDAACAAPSGADLELILNGDTIDFSAEGLFGPGVADAHRAVARMEAALDRVPEVCGALDRFLDAHCLTIIAGDRDVELSLPEVCSRLVDILGARKNAMRFVHAGGTCRRGRLLVEHGHRYDPWNIPGPGDPDVWQATPGPGAQVDHARIPHGVAGPSPVANVICLLAERLGFVNLLKPADATVALLLHVLRPEVGVFLRPGGPGGRAAARDDVTRFAQRLTRAERRLLQGEIDQLFALDKEASEPSGSLLESLAAQDPPPRLASNDLEKLRVLLKTRLCGGRSAGRDVYQVAAENLLRDEGTDLVVFGHTHRALRVGFAGGTYMNTGTWTHQLDLPETCRTGTARAAAEFRAYIRSLLNGTFENCTSAQLTYADIRLSADGAVDAADLREFRNAPIPGDRVLVSTSQGRCR
jgi:hypothetical protein